MKNEINNLISDSTEGQGSQTLTTSKQMLFEVLKLRIRGVPIPYCAKRKKKLNEKEKSIEAEIQSLETSVVNNSEENKIEDIQVLKEE